MDYFLVLLKWYCEESKLSSENRLSEPENKHIVLNFQNSSVNLCFGS